MFKAIRDIKRILSLIGMKQQLIIKHKLYYINNTNVTLLLIILFIFEHV